MCILNQIQVLFLKNRVESDLRECSIALETHIHIHSPSTPHYAVCNKHDIKNLHLTNMFIYKGREGIQNY